MDNFNQPDNQPGYNNGNNGQNPYGSQPGRNQGNGYNPYGWGNGQPGGYYAPQYRPEPRNPFATAAMIVGLCSLLSLCTIFLPVPLGALGILFVILSRRKGKKLQSTALTGLVTSIIGMVLGIGIFIAVIASSLVMLKPENRDMLNEQFEEMYGIDFDEYMERLYGEDFESLEDLYY